jgi:hypothetical protein
MRERSEVATNDEPTRQQRQVQELTEKLADTRRNWKFAAAALAVVAFFVGRDSASDAGPVRDQLRVLEQSSNARNTEFHELWNDYASFADSVGREDLGDELRAQYEPSREDR